MQHGADRRFSLAGMICHLAGIFYCFLMDPRVSGRGCLYSFRWIPNIGRCRFVSGNRIKRRTRPDRFQRVIFLYDRFSVYAKSCALRYKGSWPIEGKTTDQSFYQNTIYLYFLCLFFIVFLPCPSHLGFGRIFAVLLGKRSDLLHESEELFVALPEKHPFVVTKNDGYLGVARQIFAATFSYSVHK